MLGWVCFTIQVWWAMFHDGKVILHYNLFGEMLIEFISINIIFVLIFVSFGYEVIGMIKKYNREIDIYNEILEGVRDK